MKKLLLLIAAFAIFSCEKKPEAPKDYVTLSGKIENKNSDSIVVRTRTYSKTIKVNEDGTFKDTLKVANGMYNFFDGKESTSIYLENDFDINITLDTKMFDETVKYSGKGAVHSNFLAEDALMQEKMLNMDMLTSLDSLGLEKEIGKMSKKLKEFYASKTDVDSTIIANKVKDVEPMLKFYKEYAGEAIALKKELPRGKVSPTFDYENHKGGKTSLANLKGKFVYIDVWATWCGPCIAEIPSLKKVEKQYHGKNIEFVSISIDTPKAYETWKKMVTDKDLGGTQLIADDAKDKESFINKYKISSIPRFIMIDPEGNIVSADAPRPSSPELIKLFNELKI
ncbi:TlpA disulfide reductase family protein [uncultured Kordia sp.]|uniref:TlpA family protein disulfide reductase n=1 Tax=uncultured Kordia sp. TaxID=507699 RepID=UPI00260523F0|nr:TlpA disulfide reductase family protein [uncultured Kordia sp.]